MKRTFEMNFIWHVLTENIVKNVRKMFYVRFYALAQTKPTFKWILLEDFP